MKGKEIIFALSILALPMPTLAGMLKMMVEAETSTTIRQQMGLAAPHQENQLRL